MPEPLFRKLDCYILRADDLDAAVAFYRDHLGHQLVWRTTEAVAFRLPESDAEIVLHRQLGPEVYFLVADAEQTYGALIEAGARSVKPPFDIDVGRCAVVQDPFGNTLAVLDLSKGQFVTDSERNVVGVRR